MQLVCLFDLLSQRINVFRSYRELEEAMSENLIIINTSGAVRPQGQKGLWPTWVVVWIAPKTDDVMERAMWTLSYTPGSFFCVYCHVQSMMSCDAVSETARNHMVRKPLIAYAWLFGRVCISPFHFVDKHLIQPACHFGSLA